MCGIAGVIDHRATQESLARDVLRMTDALKHRGPDDQATWIDPNLPVAFGHRRLSILDLSPNGRQPMISRSGRYVIVYNGEIYNYREIAKDLALEVRGGSDTEVLLAAIEACGIEGAVERFVGMFAFAVYDCQRHEISLVRDRLGIKPLYYANLDDRLLFASEIKSILAYPGFAPSIDIDSVACFIRHKYINAPRSIFREVRQLPPGSILTRSIDAGSPIEVTAYWSVDDAVSDGIQNRFSGSLESAVDELERLLLDSVQCRMIADVPLGAFLSGGIDSTTVVALMQRVANQPVRTFSIGFAEEEYNEAAFAKEVAQFLGTEHTEFYVSSDDALRLVPRLADIYDEPFADASQIPTFLISELTRRSVTVSLSGDGGDELFCGYDRYTLCANYWSKMRRIPNVLRGMSDRVAGALSDRALELCLAPSALLPASSRYHRLGSSQFRRLAALAATNSPMMMFDAVQSKWEDNPSVVLGAQAPEPLDCAHPLLDDLYDKMMCVDQVTYLPGDILTKVDRASMAVGLEARVPLLDHRVVEFAWRLPIEYKISEGETKLVLRRLLERYVPRTLTDRPKKGFGVPLNDWLRGPLRGWGDDLLDASRLNRQGLLDTDQVVQRWTEHRNGERDWGGALWSVIMLQAWMDAHMRN